MSSEDYFLAGKSLPLVGYWRILDSPLIFRLNKLLVSQDRALLLDLLLRLMSGKRRLC